jgi:putative transcriptional regulator
VRIFAGCAGWSPGQLETEITAGAWFVIDAFPHDVLAIDPIGLWADVLRRVGPETLAATHPPQPWAN